MFRNDYQGGLAVDIFSAQGKDPVAKWKLYGRKSSISKVFDKEVKGFVYSLEGSSQTHKMQLPKDSKMTLGLVQKFLILQVNVPLGKDFSTEILVTDEEHLKKRLYLSTVHKELSATPLHARIPLSCLKRNTWCNLCIDLDSLTAEIFRGTRFLSLDGIIISACCKVRRIFTMKNEPAGCMDGEISYGPKEEIPRNCQFPSEVQNVVQLVNMKTLGQSDLKSGPTNSDAEETGGVKESITRGPTPRDSSHIAFGSKVIGPPPLTARKSSTSANRKEERAKSELSLNIPSDRTENVQPRPPLERPSAEKIGSRRPQRIQYVRRGKSNTDKEGGKISLNPEGPELQGKIASSSLQTLGSDLPVEDKLTDPVLRDCASSADTSGSSFKPPCASSPPECVLTTDDADLCDTETELSLCDEEYEEEIFTFSSCPHSARRNQASSNPVEDLTFGLKGHKLVTEGDRKDARLEDDFVGSESEEDEMHTDFLHRCAVHFITAPPPPPSIQKYTVLPKFSSESITTQASTAQHVSEGPKRHEPMRIAPTRCLSPSTRQGSRLDRSEAGRALPDGDTRISINRASVREISLKNSGLQKVSFDERVQPLGSSTCDLRRSQDEEDELRMLASLKREQEEEGNVGGPGLSASQVHHCNISLSASSDDTSTWTQCIPLPVDQGQHYQKEMNPLLHSNPREWMDVLSPPIVHPNQQTADGKEDQGKVSPGGAMLHNNSGEEEFLNLMYDSCLNCYFDPQSCKYYELL
ncbi:protein CFAP20DC-like isoform X1 [Carassius carassius]|uniref:protein CFAP20DC-like isoform X1 n=1 Tax=Carassius carassius TaxID=217509 RepID=UPI0028693E8D|nr:protein CFAP20DC-like isoform X1 [Carassius carassius]